MEEIKNDNIQSTDAPKKKYLRETIYDKINIPIKSLDKFIICMTILLFVSIILGLVI